MKAKLMTKMLIAMACTCVAGCDIPRTATVPPQAFELVANQVAKQLLVSTTHYNRYTDAPPPGSQQN